MGLRGLAGLAPSRHAGFAQFKTDLEAWIWGHYTGDYAGVRLEWAKGWAYTPDGAWTSAPVLGGTLPASFSAGQASTTAGPRSGRPGRLRSGPVFSNPFLDPLMGWPGIRQQCWPLSYPSLITCG